MKNIYCEVCGYKTFSKSKERHVMCECQWWKEEQKEALQNSKVKQ